MTISIIVSEGHAAALLRVSRPTQRGFIVSLPRRVSLTTRAHEAFALAHDIADRLGHDDVTPVHIVLGVLREGRSAAVAALYSLNVPLVDLYRELEAELPPPGTPRASPPERAWRPSDEQVIEQARSEARELGTEYYSCEHLLLALLRDAAGAPARVLARHGVGFDDVRNEVQRIYANARRA